MASCIMPVQTVTLEQGLYCCMTIDVTCHPCLNLTINNLVTKIRPGQVFGTGPINNQPESMWVLEKFVLVGHVDRCNVVAV
jgi:hypothetical protein